MKKFNLSLVAVLAMSTYAIAGGDIAPVEPVIETPIIVEEIAEVSEGSFYLGAAYSLLKSDSNFFDASVGNRHFDVSLNNDYSAIMAQAGYKFNQYVALEGRYWAGLTDNEFTVLGDTFDSGANAWGIYVKPMYPITDALDIYGLIGYASVTASDVGTGNGNTEDFDIDGLSWGVGAAYSFTENFAVFVDYVDFQDDDISYTHTVPGTGGPFAELDGTFEHAFDAINFGVTYQF